LIKLDGGIIKKNRFIILNWMNESVFISVGTSCIVKEALKELNLCIPERLPFDWIGTNSDFIAHSLRNNFKDWTEEYFYVNGIHGVYNMLNIQHKYGGNTGFIHELDYTHLIDYEKHEKDKFNKILPIKKESLSLFVENYQRRIKRLNDLMESDKKLVFIFHNYRDNMMRDVLNLWLSLNKFCHREFTLICIFHTKEQEMIKYKMYKNDKAKCYVYTYYTDGKYSVNKSREYLRDILKMNL